MPTRIEWADETWNPITGCTKISEGCRHCYAEQMARRLAGRFGYPEMPHHFDVTVHEDKMDQPLRWKKPRRIFVCSMGDLFHDDVPVGDILTAWQTMDAATGHQFLVLTKRPRRMASWLHEFWLEWNDPPLNVLLGVTAENQARADERIPILLQIPAAGHFVSLEPMLGAVNLAAYLPIPLPNCPLKNPQRCICVPEPALDWVIAGGESGPSARPTHPQWVRSVRDQCQEASVPFFWKGWGAWLPYDHDPSSPMFGIQPDYHTDADAGYSWTKVGKKAAGRLLDGREWDEYPEVMT